MSKSRLEKFLYALYSLDSSDLPKPLSRIEELYNCLVTGEGVPTFEPLSRVEKYLMAILGVYDVDSLPNPISRVEVLLYKLAIGDDNLDDVKSFLSEHEELLAEIIRNGGVGGNIDIEYVLYTLSTRHDTLYNTAEKPVKSAILSGQTLVNSVNNDNWFQETNGDVNLFIQNISIKKDQTYTVIGKIENRDISDITGGTPAFRIRTGANSAATSLIYIQQSNAVIKQTFTNNESDTIHIRFYNQKTNYKKLMIIEGDYTNVDIPYFEGMQSVKMPVLTTTGKNLFDGKMELGSITTKGIPEDSVNCLRSVNFIKIKPSTLYTITNDLGYTIALYEYDSDFKFIKNTTYNNTHTTLENAAYIKIKTSASKVETDLSVKFQVEQGSTATSYEPFKSNILTVNEEVELRGIGEVKDELDLTTGKLTQRIGEVVLDGNEVWYVENATGGYYTSLNDLDIKLNLNADNVLCDRFKYRSELEQSGIGACALGGPRGNKNGNLLINYDGLTGGVENFKNYLKQNPLTIQVQTEESIKTVDLSVVDQDGNSTRLKTFNDITHVTLSSEGVIPEAELEVATKNEEDLEDTSVYTTYTLSEKFNTLYNTAEKPVKSAFLKGQTWYRVNGTEQPQFVSTYTFEVGKYLDITTGEYLTGEEKHVYNENYWVIPTGTKTITLKGKNNYKKVCFYNSNKNFIIGYNHQTSSTTDQVVDVPTNAYYFRFNTSMTRESSNTSLDQYLNVYVGDYLYATNKELTQELVSVKMPVLTTTGKNLFNYFDLVAGAITFDTSNNVNIFEDGWYQERTDGIGFRLRKCIKVKPNTNYYANFPQEIHVMQYKANGDLIKGNYNAISTGHITTSSETHYINLFPSGGITSVWVEAKRQEYQNCYISESEAMTSYEPYKSNILTVNDDVKLRGGVYVNGELKEDILDLISGEHSISVGETVLNGSENWTVWYHTDTLLRFMLGYSNMSNLTNIKLQCDKIPSYGYNQDAEGLYGNGGKLCLIIDNSDNKLLGNTVDDLKTYLSQNPITVQYPLKEKSIKTVDLSVIDQDGNSTRLKTFNDITHVTLSSEGLIPEAELEVAEKVTEVAASMLTISRKQEVINTTANEQSENTDATMIATTEIYEELL